MSNKAICSKASKFHQRAAWRAGLRGPCTNRTLFRALLACFTPAVQAELDDFRKKEKKKSDGEAAKFQSRDHQRPARLQAASLGGFPCHSYPTRLHLLPGRSPLERGGGILGKLERLQQLGRTENIGFFSGSWEKPQPSTNIRGGARIALRWGGGGVFLRHGLLTLETVLMAGAPFKSCDRWGLS